MPPSRRSQDTRIAIEVPVKASKASGSPYEKKKGGKAKAKNDSSDSDVGQVKKMMAARKRTEDAGIFSFAAALKKHNIYAPRLKANVDGSKKAYNALIERLKKHQTSIANRIINGSLVLDDIIDKDEYDVSELISSRMKAGNLEFLVLWADFPLEEASYESCGDVSVDAITDFYEKFPNKPGKTFAMNEIAERQDSEDIKKGKGKKGKKSKKSKTPTQAPTPAADGPSSDANLDGNLDGNLDAEMGDENEVEAHDESELNAQIHTA